MNIENHIEKLNTLTSGLAMRAEIADTATALQDGITNVEKGISSLGSSYSTLNTTVSSHTSNLTGLSQQVTTLTNKSHSIEAGAVPIRVTSGAATATSSGSYSTAFTTAPFIAINLVNSSSKVILANVLNIDNNTKTFDVKIATADGTALSTGTYVVTFLAIGK